MGRTAPQRPQLGVIPLTWQLLRSEGIGALYAGLSAGLFRQATYTTTRMGCFRTISNHLSEPDRPLPFWKKIGAGVLAGLLASLVGCPSDLVIVLLQADPTLPAEQRRNYQGLWHAMLSIVRDEGFTALWKGGSSTIIRNVAVNVAMLSFSCAVFVYILYIYIKILCV